MSTAGLREKDLSIESLRAVAIVLMVSGHVMGGTSDAGMGVADDTWWRYFYVGLEDVRMPLFTVLSGYVYAYRPTTSATWSRMMTGKARRLLVPLLTVGPIFFLIQLAVPDTHADFSVTDMWIVPVYGYEHFWFLLALFLIFTIVGCLDSWQVLDDLRSWLAALALSVVLYVAIDPTGLGVFSVNGALRLLPFFLLGYGLHRFGARVERRAVVAASAVIFVVVYAVRVVTVVADAPEDSVAMRALRIAVGLTAVLLMMAVRSHVTSRSLAWLGQFSFAVYLLHIFGSSGTRIVLARLGVEQDAVVFCVSLVVAIALPVAFELTFGRIAWISWAFLGQKPRRSASRSSRRREALAARA